VSDSTAGSAEQLRNDMVDTIVANRAALGWGLSNAVEAALRAVPRHLFVPDRPLHLGYVDDAVVTKRDADGLAISSVSAPNLIASMLDQLEAAPGDRVLEIGSGGYNAALLHHLVQPGGVVTTVDIDPDVVKRARACLIAARLVDVTVLCADGETGAQQYAPFDRIIVTVGAWDLPPAWTDQLAPAGRLVVPLRMRGLTRSAALESVDGHLVSRSLQTCGFVAMQGSGQHRERLIRLHTDQVGLRIDDDRPIDENTLAGVLEQPAVRVASGVSVGPREPFDQQDLWLATALDDFCLLSAQEAAVADGLVSPSWRLGTPALVNDSSIAYRSLTPVDTDGSRFEFGAIGHGPNAATLCEQLVEQIRVWHDEYRGKAEPVLHVYPAGTPDEGMAAGRVMDKRHTRLVLSWP
jgi:protein-L-isoaspartate(D-aspartate) O-methyltransferase